MYNNYKKDSYYKFNRHLKPFTREKIANNTRHTPMRWAHFVEGALAQNSQLLDILEGCLVIEVSHVVYKNQLNFAKKQLIAKVNQHYPILKITNLKIIVNDKFVLS
jgi:hypothetical protein